MPIYIWKQNIKKPRIHNQAYSGNTQAGQYIKRTRRNDT